MAGEAFGLVLCGRGRPDALVGVVAGDAAERAAALGVAPAPGPARPLRADPAWFFAVAVPVAPVEDVAVVALLLRDSLGRGGRGVDDRPVGKAGRDRREVVAPGAVTTLAADGAVGRLGADPLPPRTRVGDVAIQAIGNLSPHADRFALEVLGLGRIVDGEDRPIPALALRRVVIREPRDAVLIAARHG